MSEAQAPNFMLYEHAIGYALFTVKEFEDIGLMLPQVQEAIMNVQRFSSIVQVHAFVPFTTTESALENANCIAEGVMHDDLLNFLEANLPSKRKKVLLGVNENKIGSAITEKLGVRCAFTGVVPEISRGLRAHFAYLVKDLEHHGLDKAELSLGHNYSRSKVKFDIHRVDNMVIQAIALLDQLDKDVNLFGMRIREWYSYHFPELYQLVHDYFNYIRCAAVILDRKNFNQEVKEKLNGILNDEALVEKIEKASQTSMGMEIAELDLANIEHFVNRIAGLIEYRERLHQYVKDRMDACAPSLSTLIGEQVGARLLSHAGSLVNLAKCPASTIQILGAEKALFRAIKTRTKTPKYGLLYNSSFIGRAAMRNKGRISRFLANKCAMASRIDCFSDVPLPTFGEHLRQQVEERLKYFEKGALPKKNMEVMREAIIDAQTSSAQLAKQRKKAAKKARKEAAAELARQEEPAAQEDVEMAEGEHPELSGIDTEGQKKRSKSEKRARKEAEETGETLADMTSVEAELPELVDMEPEVVGKKKGKSPAKRAQK